MKEDILTKGIKAAESEMVRGSTENRTEHPKWRNGRMEARRQGRSRK